MTNTETIGDSETFDIEEFKARIRRARELLTEALDMTTTPEEQEQRKRDATETPIQEADSEEEDDTPQNDES